MEAEPPSERSRRLSALIRLSEEYPDRASVIVNEAMAAGWRGLDQRDRLINAIAEVVEQARAHAPAQTPTPTFRSTWSSVPGAGLAPPLRRGERDLSGLQEDFLAWVESYELPTGEHRWHIARALPRAPPSPHESQISLFPPPPIPPGRSRLSKSEIRNQRERIVYATAMEAAEKGYNLTTIADIAGTAGVDRRVFYNHFHDKQQAFLAVHELGIQQIMALSASAFLALTLGPSASGRQHTRPASSRRPTRSSAHVACRVPCCRCLRHPTHR